MLQVLSDRACLMSHVLGLGPSSDELLYYETNAKNDFNYYQKANGLSRIYSKILSLTASKPLKYVFWTNALYLAVYAATLLVCCLKKYWALSVYVLIVSVNVPVIFVIGVSRDMRYLYMLPYCLPFLPILYLISKRNAAAAQRPRSGWFPDRGSPARRAPAGRAA